MNQVLKTIIVTFIALSLLSSIAYIVMTQFTSINKGPCEDVISYKVGAIDERFDLSRTDAIRIVQSAEGPWESAHGHELFTYDPNALFAVNFIYDERQKRFDESEIAMDQIASAKEVLLDRSEVHEEVEKEYSSALAQYEKKLATYEKEIASYNATVQKWNARGGAPEEVFEDLESTQADLEQKSSAISQQADRVNMLATQLNEESSELGTEANEINTYVQSYNSLYGTERAFDQGTFTEKEINVFQFVQEEDLTLVLVHEFGHALGIDHVEDSKAIMYPMLGEQNLETIELHQDDVEALFQICSTQ